MRDLPAWVSNPAKYDRAALELKRTGQIVTEERIKLLYIKYGGLVLSVEAAIEIPPAPVVTPAPLPKKPRTKNAN